MDNCIICGSEEYSVLFPANLAQKQRIVKCKKCGFLFANPQSTEEISGKISYDDMLPDNARKVKEKGSKEKRYLEWLNEGENYLIKQHVQMKDYQKVLDFLEKRKGSLLDIGAYAGVFLHYAKEQGWVVTGIEPMEEAAEYSRREYGLEMIEKPLELIEFKEKFDAVVSFHVIEHVYDPRLFLKRIHGIIKENGVLVLETPTYDSLIFKILRHRERSVRCPGHMFFFTRKSLNSLLENNGYEIIKNIKVGRTLTFARILKNIGIVIGSKGLNKFLDKLCNFLKLEKHTITINLRDMQRVYCTPIKQK